MNLFPLSDRVIVEIDKTEKVTAGGIILPDQHVDRMAPVLGTIVHLGEESHMRLEEWVEIGDRVLINKYQGVKHEVDGVEYTLLRADDVLGVFWSEDKIAQCYKERENG